MQRQVIIIGAPGDYEVARRNPKKMQFYNGVCRDIANFENYFSSPLGGGYYLDKEIKTLHNPTWNILKNCLSAQSSAFTIIVYSGHGYTEQPKNSPRLNINDSENPRLSEIVEHIQSKRVLFIVDACRTFIDGEESRYYSADGSDTQPMEFISNVSTQTARLILEQHMHSTMEGLQILFSSGPNEESYLNHNGSFFSNTLLSSAQAWANRRDTSGVLLGKGAISLAVERIKIATEKQNPKIYLDNARSDFPFAVKQPGALMRSGFYSRQ